jgi:predicted deacylase
MHRDNEATTGSRLVDLVEWERVSVPAGASVGEVDLAIGRVGSGRPVGLVVAGIHGDEGPWGAWAIRKLLEATSLGELRGSLRIVPVANPLAMEADARNSPLDSLDLNRSFPGRREGSHTERLAAALTEGAVEGADVVLDLHGGGSWCVNAFSFSFPGGEEISRALGAPFTVRGVERDSTLIGYARKQGAIVAALEMGGRSEAEEQWADRIAASLRRALGVAGVLAPLSGGIDVMSVRVGVTKVLRPSRGGVFKPILRTSDVGTIVPEGTRLGHLLDPFTMDVVETFEAPFPETAILLLRPTLARVEGGAMTYVVAPVLDQSETWET